MDNNDKIDEELLRRLTLRALIAVRRPEDKNLTVTAKRCGVPYMSLQGMTSGRDIAAGSAGQRNNVTNAQRIAAYLNVTVKTVQACAMNSLEARMEHARKAAR